VTPSATLHQRTKPHGGIRHQFHHVIDIVRTILEATGIRAPDEVDGIKQKPIEGVSMMYTFANANAPSRRRVQYFEMAGNRGIYSDGFDGPMARCEISVSYRKELVAPAKFVTSLRYGLTPETPVGGFVPVGNCFEHLQALTTRLRVRFQWARLITLAALIASRSAFAGEPTTEPLLRLETGNHTAIIRRIATDKAGRWAVTASDDKTARVWEVATGREVMVLRPPQDTGNEGKPFAVAMSPDGSTVAVGGWTNSERIAWERAHARMECGERTRPRVQFPASRRKTLFGEHSKPRCGNVPLTRTPNATRETRMLPRTSMPNALHFIVKDAKFIFSLKA
jgi:hypothetical protein